MAEKILSRVLIMNHVQLLNVIDKRLLNCPTTQVIGQRWLVPVVKDGILLHYKEQITATKPTIDSVNSVKVRDVETQDIYFVALADAATAVTFATECNKCCDATTVEMPAVTVPKVHYTQVLCGNDTDGYTLEQVVPALQAGKNYNVYGSKNNVAFAPASSGNMASVAAFVTWANTNWSAYGSFAAVGQTVTWTTATGGTGALVFEQV